MRNGKCEVRGLMFEVKRYIDHQPSNIKHLFLIALLGMVVLSGCSSSPLANQLQYVLNPGQPQQVVGQQTPRVLEVDRFTIEAAFATKTLVYRTGELQYQADFYNEFLVVPAVMITEQTRDWLSHTGLFLRVSGPSAAHDPDAPARRQHRRALWRSAKQERARRRDADPLFRLPARPRGTSHAGVRPRLRRDVPPGVPRSHRPGRRLQPLPPANPLRPPERPDRQTLMD